MTAGPPNPIMMTEINRGDPPMNRLLALPDRLAADYGDILA